MEAAERGEPVTRVTVELLPDPAAPAAARAAISRLEGVPSSVLDDLRLLVSEVVANAVRHGGDRRAGIFLDMRIAEGGVRVGVSDPRSSWQESPLRRPAASGFGLRVLRLLADDWGWAERPVSTVWFRLDTAGLTRARSATR